MRSVMVSALLVATSLTACHKGPEPASASDPTPVVHLPTSDNAPENMPASTAKKVPDAEVWRAIATDQDKQRIRNWYSAWQNALSDARAKGYGAQLDADPILFKPTAALNDVRLVAGNYRCRTTKLGSKGRTGLSYVQYAWFRCQVVDDSNGKLLMKITGSQRPSGRVFADEHNREVFLGTLALGDEQTAVPYGSDRMRDIGGVIERIGDQRWRLVIPQPAYESLLDVVELIPDR
ncbi:DUF4893 domain-containing protein [Sphingopyxis yananensis]|uniref:DUF4893 domain-containing protein n=1 Tax=Sphingopyxis yananensis TaxID=2886687 RepID=UPI001D1287F0|nr:DUF4893 domain-containing protein [Sphingopyxis yananensis]MCC2602315.1 DUF4893 domain-containing protein [Sphingopyxis yananensis]